MLFFLGGFKARSGGVTGTFHNIMQSILMFFDNENIFNQGTEQDAKPLYHLLLHHFLKKAPAPSLKRKNTSDNERIF